MNITGNNFSSIEQMTEQLQKKKQTVSHSLQERISFEEVFKTRQEEKQELKFSKHANDRLASRNIDLSKEQLQRLENGACKARAKGIRESLVMIDNLAFIVNVKNSTVVTAVAGSEDKIFTNIDGAVIS